MIGNMTQSQIHLREKDRVKGDQVDNLLINLLTAITPDFSVNIYKQVLADYMYVISACMSVSLCNYIIHM